MKISVISPCHVNDLYCLPNYFTRLNNQTRLPNEVIIYVQPTATPIDFNPYDYISESVFVKIITSVEPTPMGYNKNRAAENASGDIFCFMDIDDEPHPQKLEIVENFFNENSECDILLHTYLMNNQEILNKRYSTNNIPFDKLICGFFDGSNYRYEFPNYPLHNAHSSLKKEIWESNKFKEEQTYFRRDDSHFILENFNSKKNIFCININLVNFVK